MSDAPRPVTPLTQAIRLATTITGGVSLTVWMGGVTREINLLSQASEWRRAATAPPPGDDDDPGYHELLTLYWKLLDLLDVTVDVDVISGTSAGAINAAFLGYARAGGRDLGKLRDLWLRLGAMDDLLRDPADPVVPSLMYGDLRMYGPLATAFPTLDQAARPTTAAVVGPEGAPSTTLFIPTTLLTGETSRFTDAFGTLIQDVNHRGLFRFTQDQLSPTAGESEAKAVNRINALALAARSSSAFPGAFEPSFIPFDVETSAAPGIPARPPMRDYADITRSHWAADGGLLDNQPIDVLLQKVFDRRASRPVRRVLLYVVPSNGPEPDPMATVAADDPARPYDLIEALMRDLSAVASQSIAADLRAIRDHNDAMTTRGGIRLQLAALAGERMGGARLLTPGLLADYRRTENDRLAADVVPALMRQLSTWPAGAPEPVSPRDPAPFANPASSGDVPAPASRPDPQTIPPSWQPQLAMGTDIEQLCRTAITTALAQPDPDPNQARNTALPNRIDQLAGYGPTAYDGAKATVLAILRLGYQLASTPEQRASLAALTAAVHSASAPLERPQMQRLVDDVSTGPAARSVDLPAAAVMMAREYVARTPVPADAWRRLAEVLSTATAPPAAVTVEPQTSAGLAEPVVPQGSTGDVEPAALLAELIRGATTATPGPAITAPSVPASVREQDRVAAEQLAVYYSYLGLGTDTAPGARADSDSDAGARPDSGATSVASAEAGERTTELALRLFDLSAAVRAMLPVDAGVEQPVDLIQLSADTRTLLDPARRTAHSKLTGEQLHHFGAFYKASWRANDWMWGRLDAAGWLVHLLLDPRRLPAVVEQAPGSKAQWLIGRLGELGLGDPEMTPVELTPATATGPSAQTMNRAAIEAELAFLDDRGLPVPLSLPLTAMWVARAWQRVIAAAELPVVAQQIGTEGPAASTAWAQTLPSDQAELRRRAAELLTACPVPDETFATEAGSRLMVETLAKSAATTAAALGSIPQLPRTLRPAVITIRTVTLAGYRLVLATGGVARRVLLAGLIVLIAGVALAVRQSSVLGVSGTLLAAVGGYLIVFGAWQISRRVLGAVLSVTVVGAAAVLTLPFARRALFGTSTTDTGSVGRRVHWVGDTWWHPLLVVGAALLLTTLAGVVADPVGRRLQADVSRRRDTLAVVAAVVISLLVIVLLAIGTALELHSHS